MITCKFVIGVALQSYQLMQTLNMMTIWLNAQSFCILQRGFQFPSYLASMEISPEDIPMQMMEVLGNMALDYGAQNGHLQKRRRDQTSKPFSPNKDGKVEDNSKMLFLMVQLLLRHERDLMAVQAQNSYVLFISTNKEGMMASLLQESVNWKKAQKENQVTMPLRQHLFQFLLKTLLHRVLKLKDCKPTDPLWESSLQSQLLLKDGSWPFQVWNAQKKSQELDGKKKSIPMGEMQTHLEQMFHMVEAPDQVVRFHSLQSKSKDVPVLPWKLEIDVKNSKLHTHIQMLVGCTVWQLLSLRIKKHHLTQSKLADELMKISKSNFRGKNSASD